jgi:hypothetical protein
MDNILRIKGNIQKMIDQGAPESDIDLYIQSEGVSPKDLQAGSSISAQVDSGIGGKPVINNPDGSFSTERTITAGIDGKYFNIPTIVNGQQISSDQATQLFKQGKNKAMGTFETEEEALSAAKDRSARIGETIDPSTGKPKSTPPGFRGSGTSGSWDDGTSLADAERREAALPEMAGGIAGGLLATSKRTPAGMALSGLGGAGGEAWKQIYQQITGDPNAPDTVEEALERIGKSGITMALGEGAGRAIFTGASKVLAPFKKNVIEEVSKANKAFSDIMKTRAESNAVYSGIKNPPGFTPAQISTNKVVDTLEEIASKSFTGGERMRNYYALQNESYKQMSTDLLDDFSGYLVKNATPEEVGIIFQNSYAARNAIYRRLASIKYNKVDRLAGQASVSLVPLKAQAQELIHAATKRKGIGSTAAKDALLEKVLKLDDTVSFKESQAIRSGLMDEIATMSSTADIGRGIAQKFVKLTDGAMETSAKNLSPEAYKAWRDANNFYRGYKEKFSNDFMKSLVKVADKSPEKVVEKIFQNGAVTQIRNVKKIMPQKTFDTLKASYLKKIMEGSINGGDITEAVGATGMNTGKMMERPAMIGKSFVTKLKAMGNPALKEIFTQKELDQIYKVALTGETIQKPIASGGGMLVQLMQGSGAIGLVTGQLSGRNDVRNTGAIVMLGPAVLARMMLNPTSARYLTAGFKLPAGTKTASIIGAKLLSEATKYHLDEQDQSISKP